jgi:hypothetical protein
MFSAKRLGVLFAALLVGTMALGIVTSAAWFTDSDTVAITATSGGIEVNWDGPNAGGFTVSNLMPQNGFDASPKYDLFVFNSGSSDSAVKYRITDSFTSESVAGFYDELWVRATEYHCGSTAEVGVAYEGPLADLEFSNQSYAAKYNPLPSNHSACYWFQFALSQFAGNEFQNQSAPFDLVLDATQPENPGWAEDGT